MDEEDGRPLAGVDVGQVVAGQVDDPRRVAQLGVVTRLLRRGHAPSPSQGCVRGPNERAAAVHTTSVPPLVGGARVLRHTSPTGLRGW